VPAPLANFACAPHGGVRSPNVASELHARFIAAHNELGSRLTPRSQHERHVRRHVFLEIRARRHVKQSPSHILEASLDRRPSRRHARVHTFFNTELHRKAYSDEDDTGVIGEQPNRRRDHRQKLACQPDGHNVRAA
jgi:hypothetical protein